MAINTETISSPPLEREPSASDNHLEAISRRLIEFASDKDFPADIKEALETALVRTSQCVQDVQHASREEALEKVFSFSESLGTLDEIVSQIKARQEEILAFQREMVLTLLESYKLQLDTITLTEFNDAEGVASLTKTIKSGSENVYTKIVRTYADKFGKKVEGGVRNLLERLSGKMPALEQYNLVNRVSTLSGKVAFGTLAVGLSFLALGGKAFASVEVRENPQDHTLEIKRDDESVVAFSTLDRLDQFDSDTDTRSELFKKLSAHDYRQEGRGNRQPGLNYEISDTQKFDEAIESQARSQAENLFHANLDALKPSQFIKVVSAIVEEAITYDDEAYPSSSGGRLSGQQLARYNEILVKPLDQVFFGGKGICAQYSALVEAIGERLIEKGLVPDCNNLSIDDLSFKDMKHAANVYYLDASDDQQEKVVLAFTDATYDDNDETSQKFDSLDALKSHSSVSSFTAGSEIFDFEEKREIFHKVIDTLTETWEQIGARLELARLLDQHIFDNFSGISKPFSAEAAEIAHEVCEAIKPLLGIKDAPSITNAALGHYGRACEKLMKFYIESDQLELARNVALEAQQLGPQWLQTQVTETLHATEPAPQK